MPDANSDDSTGNDDDADSEDALTLLEDFKLVLEITLVVIRLVKAL